MSEAPDDQERKTTAPIAFVTVAVIVSVIMSGIVLLHSEGRSSTRAVPPLPAEIAKRVGRASQATDAAQPGASGGENRLWKRITDADAESAEILPMDDGLQERGHGMHWAQEPPTQLQQPLASSAADPSSAVPPASHREVELPVVAPHNHPVATASPALPQATPSSTAVEHEDPLERIRQYVGPGARRGVSGERPPIATPPPVAVPRELAQATPKPTPTPSVFHRSRNIPTHLIQTPLPILSNAPSESLDSPAADPSLATDAGKAPRWTDPQHPIMKELWGGPPPVPTVPSGTPRVAPVLDTPQAFHQHRSTPATAEPHKPDSAGFAQPTAAHNATRETVAADVSTRHEKEGGITPRNLAPTPPLPTNSVSPPSEKAQEREAPVASEATPTRRLEVLPSPRLYEKEILTTNEFTVRKKGVTVTFHNVPAEFAPTLQETSAPLDFSSPDDSIRSLPAEKLTQPPVDKRAGEPVRSEAHPELTPAPEGQRIERGIEELARRDEKSPLAQRLASRAIPASVGEKLLTREDISRHIRSMELLRGTTFNEDARLKAEDAVVQEWVQRTALAALAREHGLNVTEEEIRADIEKRKARYGQNLPAALREAGFTDSEVREEIANALLVDKLVAKIMQESYPEEKLREIYEAHPDQYQPSRKLHVREIFKQKAAGREQEARRAIERIRMEIAKGVNFEDLARRESDSPTRDAGGDLGWLDASTPLSPRQAQALLNIKPGEVTDIVELGDGYQILKLVEIEEPKPGFEGARHEVEKAVRQEIVARAFEEALARFDVRVRNKRIPSRLGTVPPPPGSLTSPMTSAGPKEKRLPTSNKSLPSAATKTRDASGEGLTDQGHKTAKPPAPAETKKPRLFPLLKKRQDQ